MSKVHVEWGRLSPAQPDSAPAATGQITLSVVSDAFRLASHLAHTMTESHINDCGVMSALQESVRRGTNSAYRANHRAVFWGAEQDWFVSVTDAERHSMDGGYTAVAFRILKATHQARQIAYNDRKRNG